MLSQRLRQFFILAISLSTLSCSSDYGNWNGFFYNPASNNGGGGTTTTTASPGSLVGHLSLQQGAVVLGSNSAPLSGASVTFVNAQSGITFGPVTTDSSGQFTLSGVGSGSGALVVASGSGAPTKLLVTAFNGVVTSVDPPNVSRGQATQKVQQAIAESPTFDLYLLGTQNPAPAGVAIAPALGDGSGDPDPAHTVTLSSPQWIFFVDPYGTSLFQRSAGTAIRIYFVDAQTGQVTEMDETSWPSIAGSPFYVSPDANLSSPDLIQAPVGAVAPTPRQIQRLVERAEPSSAGRTFGMLILGQNRADLSDDMVNFEALLRSGSMKVSSNNPDVQLRSPFPPLATLNTSRPDQGRLDPLGDIFSKLTAMYASMKPEDTLVLFCIAHGAAGDGTILLETGPYKADSTQLVKMQKKDLQRLLSGCPAGTIYVVLGSCYSGHWVNQNSPNDSTHKQDMSSFFDGLTGKKVVLMTASDAAHESKGGSFAAKEQVGTVFISGYVNYFGLPGGLKNPGLEGVANPGLIQNLGAVALLSQPSGTLSQALPGREPSTFGTLNLPAAGADPLLAFNDANAMVLANPLSQLETSASKYVTAGQRPQIYIRNRSALDATNLSTGDPYFPPAHLLSLDGNGADRPTISQDGSRVAFVQYGSGAGLTASPGQGVFVVNASDASRQLVTSEKGPCYMSSNAGFLTFAFDGADDPSDPEAVRLDAAVGLIPKTAPHRAIFRVDLSNNSLRLLNTSQTYSYVSTANHLPAVKTLFATLPLAGLGAGELFLAAANDGSVAWPNLQDPPYDDATDTPNENYMELISGNPTSFHVVTPADLNGSPLFAISTDGKQIAYATGTSSIMLYDQKTGNSASVTANGSKQQISDLTGNGQFVVYSSSNVAGLPKGVGQQQIYLQRVDAAAAPELVSQSGDPLPLDTLRGIANDACDSPSISADGRYVVFDSFASNLVDAPVPGGSTHIFVKDRSTGYLELVDRPFNVVPGDTGSRWAGYAFAPRISADGSTIAFISRGFNLISPGLPNFPLTTYENRIYTIRNPLFGFPVP